MPKLVRLSIPAMRVSSDTSDRQPPRLNNYIAPRSAQSWTGEIISVALFSCVGLLISLVAVLIGLQLSWY